VRAPVDGIVKTLYVVTEGGVIPPGFTLMDVVPQDAQLIVEAKLPTKDIGYVKLGQKALVRLSAADAFKYEALEGKVIAISPDALVGTQGAPYYKVSVETSKSYFGTENARYTLSPGMTLEVSIQTGERTVLQYIFDPILLGSRKAMTER
jgi:membrane fusion protein, adhesin transport system